jgi:hypothetical protein
MDAKKKGKIMNGKKFNRTEQRKEANMEWTAARGISRHEPAISSNTWFITGLLPVQTSPSPVHRLQIALMALEPNHR